ncbi:MAG: glycosyl hydrolase family 39 [Terriglobales bacterium]
MRRFLKVDHLGKLFIFFIIVSPLLFPETKTLEQTVVIDTSAPAHPFPHFWEHMFGSERAVVSMRESYRQDLREVKKVAAVEYIRFHALFHDEMGVYDEDPQGKPVYNFSYVDQVYDGLLDSGVRPFVELSFMPKKLAASQVLHAFWYKQNVAPPKDYRKWDDLITQLAQHLISRYGIDEVAKWYFEVWNEPNIDFWAGDPKQATYFELYDHTARALKAVSPRLRVGGPATAQAAWADDFIRHCVESKIPVDFVSSHVYGNDKAEDVFGTHEAIPRDRMVCRAVKKVRDQIKASAMPSLPLFWSEFNASYMNEPEVTDSAYMGPWLADTIRQCDGLVDEMSYWTFSDVFEEQGVVKQPFYGGFGLLAERGIPKPAYNVFRLLHRLGEERLTVSSESVVATRRKDGTLVVAAWNMAPPGSPGAHQEVKFVFRGVTGSRVEVSRVDPANGDVHNLYRAMGAPRYPTEAQIRQLRSAAQIPPPQTVELRNGSLTIEIPAHGLVLLELKNSR